MKIAREFHWEMGHRLPFHESGCANIHGHSYKLWIELEGELDKNGMLMDYGEMKRLVAPVIEPLDHAFLCDEHDDVMKDFLATTSFKHLHVPFHSTAENLVEYLLDKLWDVFSAYDRISMIRLRLKETDISYAESERGRTV